LAYVTLSQPVTARQPLLSAGVRFAGPPTMTARALDLALFVSDRLRIVVLALAALMIIRALV
jgi:hypothetical protein